jgi:hypothetical protein
MIDKNKHVATLYRLNDYVGKWFKMLTFEDHVSRGTATINTNTITGELEIVQTNDAGDEIKVRLGKRDCLALHEVLQKHVKNSTQKV